MSHSHPVDVTEVLISLATAALVAAEADAAQTDQLIFRNEWKPTKRTRKSTTLPQSRPQMHGLIQPQQDQPSPPPSSTTLPARPPPKHPHQPQLQEGAVEKLLKDNPDIFDKLINHPFSQALGDGSASLDGFRYYMIQDTLYLETCARLKMAAVAWSPNFKEPRISSHTICHLSSM